MDYGHELEFGAFLTPAADAIDRVLELAQLAEVRGLDFVSLQDHPLPGKVRRHLDSAFGVRRAHQHHQARAKCG